MKGLNKILLEGRVEDAQQYFKNAVGSWPVVEPDNPLGLGVGTNIEGVLQHFAQNDPSGNNKYIMWMVKMYVNPEERGTTPHDISSIVQRFHKNTNRLTMALIMNMDMFAPGSKIVTSPKNIDSYDDISQLERVMDEVDSIQTKKEKENEAKGGVDKLYEDDRWLLVKPNTHEGSCYYGSSTKWCTAMKDRTTHFDQYTKTGNLYYIIDKSKDVGDYFKLALHKNWDGEEDWYDRADKELEYQAKEAIRSLLPTKLIDSLEEDHGIKVGEVKEPLSLGEFKGKLEEYVTSTNGVSYSTQTGKWKLKIINGHWVWSGADPRIEIYATPFFNGSPSVDVYVQTDDDDLGQPVVEYTEYTELEDLNFNNYFGPDDNYQVNYLSRDTIQSFHANYNVKTFIGNIYIPILKDVLNSYDVKEYVDVEYKTWDSTSYVSSYTFKYPPAQGSMTQKFTDYLIDDPRKTSNQFYEDVLGRSRPRGHNNMFFASIKDSGIVKMERSGRQFVYSLGPNYEAWTKGKLLRIGRAYGKIG